jgi:hypothetical protein
MQITIFLSTPPLEADEVSGVVMAAHHCYV